MKNFVASAILLSIACCAQVPLQVKPDKRHQEEIAKDVAGESAASIPITAFKGFKPAVSVKLDSSPDSAGFCQQVATGLRDRLMQSNRYVLSDNAALQISVVCTTGAYPTEGIASIVYTLTDDCGKKEMVTHAVFMSGEPNNMSRMVYAQFDGLWHQ